MVKKYKQERRSYPIRVNERINFSPLLVIDEEGEKLGVLSNDEAKAKARAAGLDLVEVAPTARPPVCRIMDFGKFKYEQGLKEKKQRQKTKSHQIKEVRLSPKIANGDIVTKTNAARKFLSAGHKVQLRLEYKKRENAHKDLGFEVMAKMVEELEDIGKPMTPPKLTGRFLMCLMEPNE